MSQPSFVFMGSKDAGLRLCRRLIERLPSQSLKAIICPDDSNDPRSVLREFKELSTRNLLPFFIATGRQATLNILNDLRPRYALVHGWYQIIPVLDLPDCDFIGFHYSPLPRYRGNAPLVWQLIQGEREIGVTCFRFSSGIDEGDIADQAVIPIRADDTIGDALLLANQAMLDIADGVIERLLSGSQSWRKQDHCLATYCGLRIPDDGIIDWHYDATQVHNFVRAQSHPYPGAFTRRGDGKILRIWRTSVDDRNYVGVAGAVAEICGDQVVVTCGKGAIRILEASIDEENDAPPSQLLASLRTRLG